MVLQSGTQWLLPEYKSPDFVLILLMWETTKRGNNRGKLTWSDCFLVAGQQAPYP